MWIPPTSVNKKQHQNENCVHSSPISVETKRRKQTVEGHNQSINRTGTYCHMVAMIVCTQEGSLNSAESVIITEDQSMGRSVEKKIVL